MKSIFKLLLALSLISLTISWSEEKPEEDFCDAEWDGKVEYKAEGEKDEATSPEEEEPESAPGDEGGEDQEKEHKPEGEDEPSADGESEHHPEEEGQQHEGGGEPEGKGEQPAGEETAEDGGSQEDAKSDPANTYRKSAELVRDAANIDAMNIQDEYLKSSVNNRLQEFIRNPIIGASGRLPRYFRQGHMSINQAAIHYNLPYSSLYGRFKRGKYDTPNNANSSHSNHGGAGGGGNVIGGNIASSTAAMAGVTSSPQMEFKIEPQHNEHSPENTQHYNPALTSSLTSSTVPPLTQAAHHIVQSPSPVNIHIINSNNHHQFQQNSPHQMGTSTQQHQQQQQQLIQHHIIPQQHIIYQQPLQQLQQQPQYHPMYHIIKQENDRS